MSPSLPPLVLFSGRCRFFFFSFFFRFSSPHQAKGEGKKKSVHENDAILNKNDLKRVKQRKRKRADTEGKKNVETMKQR